MGDRLRDFWADLLGLVPEILLFLLILLVGFVVAGLLRKATDKLLGRATRSRVFTRNADRVGNRGLLNNLLGVVPAVVYGLVVLFTLYFAFGVFGDGNAFFLLFAAIVAFLPKLIIALILVVLAAGVAGFVRTLVSRSLGGLSYGRVLANVAGGFILTFGVLAALTQVGIATAILIPLYVAFLVAVVGILIVGVGGALAVTLRPLTARALDAAEDAVTNVADEATSDTDPTPVAVEPVPFSTGVAAVDPTPRNRPEPTDTSPTRIRPDRDN